MTALDRYIKLNAEISTLDRHEPRPVVPVPGHVRREVRERPHPVPPLPVQRLVDDHRFLGLDVPRHEHHLVLPTFEVSVPAGRHVEAHPPDATAVSYTQRMTDQARTDRGLDRLVNFSDATVAIAITLLILPLVDIASELTSGESAGDLLQAHWPSIVEFGITFWLISRFWILHHQVFEHVRSYNARVMQLNFVWLLSIVFLPFAANLLNSGQNDDRVAHAVYLGTMVVTSLALTGIELVLRRNPELLATPLGDSARGLIAASLLAAALILSVVFPRIGLLWALLLLLQGPVARILHRV